MANISHVEYSEPVHTSSRTLVMD